ncbi:MAG: hypothetical protein L0I76_30670 [Pseudonocardia sp.]|nr:hypothetical protein [Pseudonocardia sp.]
MSVRLVAVALLSIFLAAFSMGAAAAQPSAPWGGGRPAAPTAVLATPYFTNSMLVTYRDKATNETAFQF